MLCAIKVGARFTLRNIASVALLLKSVVILAFEKTESWNVHLFGQENGSHAEVANGMFFYSISV